MVDLKKQVPDLKIDLRYGSSRNVMGRALYPKDMPCLARRETATKVAAAQALLREQGYGLLIWDAWRPPKIHQQLHGAHEEARIFQDPSEGWSRHCGGVAIDATLVDADGNKVLMPTDFDAPLESASRFDAGTDPEALRHLSILHTAMAESGLKAIESEWWHFDDQDYRHNPQPIIHGYEVGVSIAGPPVIPRTDQRGVTLLLAEPSEP